MTIYILYVWIYIYIIDIYLYIDMYLYETTEFLLQLIQYFNKVLLVVDFWFYLQPFHINIYIFNYVGKPCLHT